ncbi:uncharacterized protein [Trachinotus anak]|uniref:uncharacterized protein isoform X2 n=1 Tax=Trachinotus anak TaxID=443729 RepID=UPI0039F20DE2
MALVSAKDRSNDPVTYPSAQSAVCQRRPAGLHSSTSDSLLHHPRAGCLRIKVCAESCTSSTAPVSSPPPPSGLVPEAVNPFTAFQVQSGLLFSPKSSQSSLRFPGRACGEAGQSPQVQPREDDSLSSAGLSSSCVAARLSASGFPGGRSCSYTLNNTGTVLLSTARFRSAEMNPEIGRTAIWATDTTDTFMLFEVRDHQMPAALSSHLFSKRTRLSTPRRRAFAHRGGANTEVVAGWLLNPGWAAPSSALLNPGCIRN